MTTEENLQQQQDELQVLASMYSEELVQSTDVSRSYHIVIPVPNRTPIIFEFWLTDNYPSKEPPMYTFRSTWITKQQRITLSDELKQLFEPGNVVLFQWIEWLKQNIYDALNLQEEKEEEYTQQEVTFEHDIQIFHSEPFTMNKSKFIAHCATIHSVNEFHQVMWTLLQDKKIAAATHNISAYRVEEEGEINEHRDDDGEIGAADQLLFLLQRAQAVNICVIVTRWYGGIHLGSDRFRIISSMANNVLQDNGYLKKKK
jgi:hypothetical protein